MIKIKENINIDNIENQTIISKINEQGILSLEKVFVLEGLGKEIFDDIVNNCEYDTILQNILDSYDISKEIAKQDLDNFLKKLEEKEIIYFE